MKSILATGLDRQPLPQLVPARTPVEHDNLRGVDYYAGGEPTQGVGGC
ncbi:MAG: hypothetical protein IRZ15_05525 [Bryobacteraceae bacterium]|nr:hypothetical protein [Bryobacteraceae bacterium]